MIIHKMFDPAIKESAIISYIGKILKEYYAIMNFVQHACKESRICDSINYIRYSLGSALNGSIFINNTLFYGSSIDIADSVVAKNILVFIISIGKNINFNVKSSCFAARVNALFGRADMEPLRKIGFIIFIAALAVILMILLLSDGIDWLRLTLMIIFATLGAALALSDTDFKKLKYGSYFMTIINI